ncbi:Fasciclin-like arabinogalactan protein 8 [Apostasia shenzhenica]|uniref:Fasciclin-like arabinogalactan protein 8 n=1 Tax=Apostasia shenzhenica TaxID=1088818 RepID=A0A2I0B1H7_9ASPA|nr:Fasciclin-like arabinogalactan protein 8 [Apostasia shenzhenica]
MDNCLPTSRPFAAATAVLVLAVLASFWPPEAQGHNITEILEKLPEYGVYNSYMSLTKIADEVNSRRTITCLVLPNSAMSAVAANRSLATTKNALRLLVLLDYFDPQKLHDLPAGTTLTTTLYQTTGVAVGKQGFVNITNVRGGRVVFSSAATGGGSKPISEYTKSIRQIPYNISVLEISAPIVFPGLLDGSPVSGNSINLTAVLETAGCRTFASLIAASGTIETFQAAMEKGLTIFAPKDEAFKAEGIPNLSSLSRSDLVTLLQYHAVPSYAPEESLKAAVDRPVVTMAAGSSGKYNLTVSVQGEDVTLHSGRDSSRIAGTVLDDTPVCILTIENILLPVELFGETPALSPAPEKEKSPSPSPSPSTTAPAPSTVSAKAPSSLALSPPGTAPESAPAVSPETAAGKADDNTPSGVPKVVPFSWLAAIVASSWALLC